jgi:UDP-N-acetylmuramyl pentapeptide phosphotransferase/UDP-N-acetylglucosamine-1-phosphate transferase
MFETDVGNEQLNEVVSRKYALGMHGGWAFIAVVGSIGRYWRWGLFNPWMLAGPILIFVFSLYWFVDVLRNGPPRKKAFSQRLTVLLLILVIWTGIRMFRM